MAVAVEELKPETQEKDMLITINDLVYLYTMMNNSNIPVREAAYVVDLQRRLELVIKK